MPMSEADKLVVFRWLQQKLAAQKISLGSKTDLIGVQIIMDNFDTLMDIPAMKQKIEDDDTAVRLAEIARLRAKLAKLEAV